MINSILDKNLTNKSKTKPKILFIKKNHYIYIIYLFIIFKYVSIYCMLFQALTIIQI